MSEVKAHRATKALPIPSASVLNTLRVAMQRADLTHSATGLKEFEIQAARDWVSNALAIAATGPEATKGAAPTVKLRISATIQNEYANRCPEHIPAVILGAGRCHPGLYRVSLDEARAVLADAEHNSDGDAFSVGKFDMPVGTWRAYKALAKQVRAAISSATGSAA